MITVSLCMIVKNEEGTIKRCIESVKEIIDEFVIVDTGSTDKTIDIIKEMGIEPYYFEWIDDFAKARNYSFSKATKDYIIWLDGDDIINPDDIQKFKELKRILPSDVDSVMMNYVLSRDQNGKFLNSLKRNRLVKREKNFKWIGSVHEYIEVVGKIIQSDINILHGKIKEHTNRNLQIFEAMKERNQEFTPRDMFYYANELYYNQKYKEAIVEYRKFIDTNKGWIEDIRDSCVRSAHSYEVLQDKNNEFKILLESLRYGLPRYDISFKLADHFFNEGDFDSSIYWYSQTINLEPNENFIAIYNRDMCTFLPWLQLCVCYSRKGDLAKSYLCHKMSQKYKPDHPSVKYNEKYFNDINYKPVKNIKKNIKLEFVVDSKITIK